MDEPFDFEFHTDEEHLRDELSADTEMELWELAEGHTDIIGAAVAIERMTGDTTPHRYRARIVAYMRPSNIAAVEKADTAEGAIQGALQALKRQVRERREKLAERWKQP
jgi:ribosome-associated translation inhibitor RaiA